ncbi:MAG: response regulator transcription factor [Lachnospiraceae bacterium]|nr:response regulator transcription factor [Lachnospiraceae bacterium]
MKYKVLLAEDERNLRNIVRTFLTQNDFEVDTANDGEEAIFAINKNVYDIIILDIMMPKKDGIEVCKYIRSKYDVPVIFLTALNQEKDIVNGYEVGADEYVVKPVSMPILMAKINALIKRYRGLMIEKGILRIGEIKIELARRLVTVSDKIVSLAPKEYDLLIYFIENKNQILSREQILNHIWGVEYEGYDRAVDTHVKKLRAALGDSNSYITTVIKKGYMWKE